MEELKAMIEYEISRIDDEYILQYLYAVLKDMNKQLDISKETI